MKKWLDCTHKGALYMIFGFPKKNGKKDAPIVITRQSQQELEEAINGLVKRGFEVINSYVEDKADLSSELRKSEILTSNFNQKRKKELTFNTTFKYVAVLKRKEVVLSDKEYE